MYFYQRHKQFFAQVAGGLEKIAAAELRELGATDLEVITRGIHFRADLLSLYRINYRSRLATRVLAPLVKFEAKTPEELYLGAKKVDWTRIFPSDASWIRYDRRLGPQLHHIDEVLLVGVPILLIIGLLAIAKHGVIYAPGSAGTIQEIFQDAAQNHYSSFGPPSPMATTQSGRNCTHTTPARSATAGATTATSSASAWRP